MQLIALKFLAALAGNGNLTAAAVAFWVPGRSGK